MGKLSAIKPPIGADAGRIIGLEIVAVLPRNRASVLQVE
jgi:hypothetical protein